MEKYSKSSRIISWGQRDPAAPPRQRPRAARPNKEDCSWFLPLDPWKNLPWLGIGDYAAHESGHPVASQLIDNAKHLPALRKIPRPKTLKSKCRIVASTPQDHELVEQIWRGKNLVFQIFDENQCFNGLPSFVAQQRPTEKLLPDIKDLQRGPVRKEVFVHTETPFLRDLEWTIKII